MCAAVAERHPGADVVVPPCSTAAPGEAAETAPSRGDPPTRRRPAPPTEGGATATCAPSPERPAPGHRGVDAAVHALDLMAEAGRPHDVRTVSRDSTA